MSNATLDKDTLTKARALFRRPKPCPLLLEWPWVHSKAPKKCVTCVMQRKWPKSTTRAIPGGKHHTRHAKFNRKGTPRWVPVLSNATLDKDTLTKALGNTQLTRVTWGKTGRFYRITEWDWRFRDLIGTSLAVPEEYNELRSNELYSSGTAKRVPIKLTEIFIRILLFA